MAGTSRAPVAGTRVKCSDDFPRLFHRLLDLHAEEYGIDLMCNASGRNGSLARALVDSLPSRNETHSQMSSENWLGMIRTIILEKRVEQFTSFHNILKTPVLPVHSVDFDNPRAHVDSWYIEYMLKRKDKWIEADKDIDSCVELLKPLLRIFAILLESEQPVMDAKSCRFRTLEDVEELLERSAKDPKDRVLNVALVGLRKPSQPHLKDERNEYKLPDAITSLSSGLDEMSAHQLYECMQRDHDNSTVRSISRPFIQFPLDDPANRDDNMPNLRIA